MDIKLFDSEIKVMDVLWREGDSTVCQPFLTGWYAAHPLKRRLSVRQSDMISSPLSYGILRPVILMPKTAD